MPSSSQELRMIDEPYPLLLRVSLALALVGGFGLGLTLLLSFVLRVPLPLSVGALIQAHGQVQALGFVALFVIAVGSRLIPRFHGAQLQHGWMVSTGGLTLAAGVGLRAVSQPLPPSAARSAMLILSGFLTLGGVLLALFAFGATVRRGTPAREREPVILPITMAVSLMSLLLLNVVASFVLAGGSMTVPAMLNEAILHFELWGFASTMILAIARHTWPSLLLLRPSRSSLMRRSLVLWAVGSLGVPIAWLLAPEGSALRAIPALSQAAGVLLYAAALRLFERPGRVSLIPLVTDDGRTWLRIAVGFLVAASAINVAAAVPALVGSSYPLTELSAARHALAQGFVVPVIVFMGARILPGYAPRMMAHPNRLAVLMGILFVGALLRAGGEFAGGYSEGWGAVVGLGAALTTVAFAVFAFELWQTTQPNRADS